MRKYSYEGIGQWSATFACEKVAEGQVVKISDSGTVSGCKAGERFDGVAVSVGRDGAACAVALGGMVKTGYSGESAPAAGWCTLAADGSGGVTVSGGGTAAGAAAQSGGTESAGTESAGGAAAPAGREYLVADVDKSARTVTFVL